MRMTPAHLSRRPPPRGTALGRLAAVGLSAVLTAAGPVRAQAPVPSAPCGAELPAATRLDTAAGELRLAFAPRNGRLGTGRHFALDLVVCSPPGRAAPVLRRVDADMPAHRHGMNYRVTLEPLGAGRYRAEGLMLHMPGRWRFLFELDDGAGGALSPLRLSREVEVE